MAKNYQHFVFTPHPVDAEMRTESYCIDYVLNDSDRWTALYSDGKFHHYKDGQKSQGHDDDYLCYKNDSGETWRMEIRGGKMYVGPNGKALNPGSMVYKGWDGKTWTADLVRSIDFHSDLM